MTDSVETVRLVFERGFGPAAVFAAAAALFFVSFPLVRARGIPGAARTAALRLLAALAFLFVFLEPAVERSRGIKEEGRIAVLVDRSLSMSIRDWPGGRSRGETALDVLRSSVGHGGGIIAGPGAELFAFADTLERRSPETLPFLRFDGRSTDLVSAFESLPRSGSDRPLRGVVLVTDGRAVPPRALDDVVAAARKMAAPGIPVYVLLASGPEPVPDVAVAIVPGSGIAATRKPFTVSVRVRSTGAGPRILPLSLNVSGKNVATRMVPIPLGDYEDKVDFEFTPERPGPRVITASVPILAGEVLPDNNKDQASLEVVRDRIRILSICGRPGWDGHFLRRLLKRDPGNDLVSFFILRDLEDDIHAGKDDLSLIPFPVNDLFGPELSGFDLVIFQDFPVAHLLYSWHLESVRRFVLEGGAFLMVGGERSFGAGGFAGTEIEDILPVDLASGGDFEDGKLVKARLTEAGRKHPIMAVGNRSRDPEQLFQALPPLASVHHFRGVKPDADVLAEAPFGAGRSEPLVVVRRVGKGRTMVFGSGSSWRWHFTAAGRGEHPQGFRAFWENSVGWLTGSKDQRLSIETARRPFAPGDEVWFDVSLPPELREGSGALPVSWDVVEPVANQPVAAGSGRLEAGRFRASFVPGGAGVYLIRARARRSGEEEPLTGEALVEVRSGALELTTIEPDRDTMRAVAHGTGGEMLPLTASSLERMRFPEVSRFKVMESRRQRLWDNWAAYGAVLLLFAAAWWSGKRSGQEP